MSIEEIILKRRTIKPAKYTGEVIDRVFVEKVLSVANWAPTHGYTEPWRFHVFTGNGIKNLYDFLTSIDREQNGENEIRDQKRWQNMSKASHIIAISMARGNNEKVPEIEEICSVACAVQNMWLMATELDIAAYWSTGSLAFHPSLKTFLGLSPEDKTLGFFYMGITNDEASAGRRLSHIEEKVKWMEG